MKIILNCQLTNGVELHQPGDVVDMGHDEAMILVGEGMAVVCKLEKALEEPKPSKSKKGAKQEDDPPDPPLDPDAMEE